jgi:hypothetical protein
MNKFKYILYLMTITLIVSSCRKTLELSPEDYFGDNNFWKNESQVANFMTGIHKQFRDNQFQFLRFGEMRGGTFSNIERQQVSLFDLPVIEQRLEETSSGVSNWGGFYSNIFQVNLFIQQVEGIDFLALEKKSYFLGQAYAIRAFYYFQLLRTYGGVPLVLSPKVRETSDPVALRTPRSTEAEVLAAIKEDVNKSVSQFGNAASPSDRSQWNPQAALMLKGEVYLWSAKVYNNTGDLAEAKTALNAITDRSLQANFADAFGYTKKNNTEIILAIRYMVGEADMGTNYSYFQYALPNFSNLHHKDSSGTGSPLVDPLNIGSATAQIIQRYGYTFELFRTYDIADSRRNATFYDYYKVDKTTTPVTVQIRNTALVKFPGTVDAAQVRIFADDWPVYREADRLLMLAEITNAEGGDPTTYIKQIRDRAFRGAANDPTPFVNGSRDANELAIFAERSKEFVYEGKRWYDLRRMKFGNDPLVFKSANHPYGVLDKATQGYKILWPIDVNVWTNDPTVDQTPGYATSKPK